jgi:hypothetical protein
MNDGHACASFCTSYGLVPLAQAVHGSVALSSDAEFGGALSATAKSPSRTALSTSTADRLNAETEHSSIRPNERSATVSTSNLTMVFCPKLIPKPEQEAEIQG